MPLKRKRRKLDGIDAEQIDNLLSSPGWALVRKRLEQTLQTKVSELAQDLDPIKTAKVRGFVEALNVAAGIPAILLREAKANRKEED